MDPARWKRIEELYHAAASRRPEERETFLEQACAGDDALRRHVQALLAESIEGRFETPALEVAAQMVSDPAAPVLIGRRVGAYQIDARIGSGGMGEAREGESPLRVTRAARAPGTPRHPADNR